MNLYIYIYRKRERVWFIETRDFNQIIYIETWDIKVTIVELIVR
jgi:hypothetical protein